MRLNFVFLSIIVIALCFPHFAQSQVSERGVPIQVVKTKSSSLAAPDLVVMPRVDNFQLREQYSRGNESSLKPFVFAHTFDVSLSLKNAGDWYNTSEVNVWQLRVKSEGAYSLNFVFENFRLPKGARLFLINQESGEIKGAYTAANNAKSGIFAVEPVAGDEIMIQYEEPVNPEFQGRFTITKVSHDFVGITTYNPRRPLGESGNCNVNINCDVANGYEQSRDAVCRIIIVNELCTGTLMNNTAQDGAPYLLTANHCINSEYKAQSSVFLFNYESPYCSLYNSPTIDGDNTNSMSGSTLKANFDSLDFALVRLNNTPPNNYRVYLAGWNRVNMAPTSTVCVHHPLGDVKKVAIDLDSPLTKRYTTFLDKGFWNVVAWDYGVTESGSSGAPLFDQNKRVVGTLTGGSADCISRKNDYFEKFALAWNYRKEESKQLKVWLDPLNSGTSTLDGKYLNSGKTLCTAATNFRNNDTQSIQEINSGITKKGYWSGTNSYGISEIAEQYKFAKNCEIQGISLGIAKMRAGKDNARLIDVTVYEGKDKPETTVYTETFDIRKFSEDAMNYLSFASPVKTTGNFYVSIGFSHLTAADTLVVYMANRKSDTTNSFLLKNTSGWTTYNTQNLNGNGSALLTEIVVCNVDDPFSDSHLLVQNTDLKIYPNPLNGSRLLNILTNDPIECVDEIVVYDLLGKQQQISVTAYGENQVGLDFSGKKPGIYFVRLQAGGRQLDGKVTYLP